MLAICSCNLKIEMSLLECQTVVLDHGCILVHLHFSAYSTNFKIVKIGVITFQHVVVHGFDADSLPTAYQDNFSYPLTCI